MARKKHHHSGHVKMASATLAQLQPPADSRIETVRIERMSYGPEAIAHMENGKTVFVAGGVPGDIARIAIVEEKATFAKARMVEVVEPSVDRVSSFCECGGLCGGCPWQNLSYDSQLKAKRDNVVQALIRTAKFSPEIAEDVVRACLPSKRQVGYRNKLELNVGQDPAGNIQLGFASQGSHNLFVPKSCPVAVKHLQKAPKSIAGALRYLAGSQDLGLFRVGIRGSVRTGDVEVALWTTPGPFPRAQVAKVLTSAVKSTSVVRVMAEPGKARKVKGVENLDGKGCWGEMLGDVRYLTSAPSFFQVNTAQAEKLIECVMDGLGDVRGALVADLYAGGGTFSIPLAKAGADVIAVESAGSSVRDLRRNADLNHVDVEVVGGDAARELPELGGLDALVVDPPRAGLADGVVESIAAAGPQKVAYVSCDPATWARDVSRFEDEGYHLVSAQPVDLFPQTFHVETVSIFARG